MRLGGILRGAEKATCRLLKNLSCSQFVLTDAFSFYALGR